jgi:3-hydroxyisobutyrate dehydrogenase-like beta-hydroxyacid dehydrogenase
MSESKSVLPPAAELHVAIIGYGEVGGIFGHGLATRGVASIDAFDVKLPDAGASAAMRQRAERDGVRLAPDAATAVAQADLVICAVTASNTRAAAQSVAGAMRRGAFYVDLNSASPRTKADCGQVIADGGGRYVESAVMTSVPPYGIKVPMLLGGPDAAAVAPALADLGCKVEVASEELGVASAIKMCRSVIVKGMEAIVIESFVTARRYGVEKQVLASLAETFPGMDWEHNGDYFFSRVIQHGKRRAEEMREAAATVREVGLAPFMASAIADRQQWVADLAQAATFGDAAKEPWRAQADRIPREGLDE